MPKVPKIHQPHDKLFRDTFRRKEVMVDFLKARLEPELLAKIDLSTLELVNSDFILSNMGTLKSDVIYKAQIAGSLGFIRFLCEHQTDQEDDHALRLLEYDVQLMRQAFKGGAKKLPIIINFVVYTGADPYRYERNIMDAFESKEAVLQMLEHNFLIELRSEDQATIDKDGKAALVEYVLRESHTKDFCKELEHKRHIVHLINRSTYGETALMWIINHDHHKPEEVLKKLRNLDPEIKGNIMTQLQRIEHRGIQIGEQRGIQIGEQKGREEERTLLSKELAKLGVDPAIIERAIKGK